MVRLTPRQQQVFEALTNEFEWPEAIARGAKIHTRYPRETASKYCMQLVRLGLAEKGGQPMFPKWRRTL